ncbi:MAG: beta-glucosidase, partial [Propionibacterium sp.]|nr:beta-glucosidase [Propionibacterium sp.]
DYWRTKPLPGIAQVMLADGPHGLRKQADRADHLGLNASVPATCFPTPAALAATWDVELVEEVGAAIGAEARDQGVGVVLGPGANIKRDPRCGRNFEYYSEDPVHSGAIAAAMIRGIQRQGVAACLKHFAANNQETDRLRISAEIDERTLREIYLASFELAIADSDPWVMMSSYNLINGRYAGESEWLLTDILRDEWGWDGVVVSDWGAVFDRVATLRAGLDLEMPYSGGLTDREVVDAVRAGSLEEAVVDRSSRRVLELIGKLPREESTADYDAHHRLARRAAAAGCVLLRNEPARADADPLLPLRTGDRLAVIGEFARTPRFQGAGSAQVTPTRLISALEAFEGRGIDLAFAPGHRLDGVPDESLVREAREAAGAGDVIVMFLGLPAEDESEGYDRTRIALPADQLALLEEVAAANPRVVVVLANGGVVTLGEVNEHAPAILESWLGGQAGAEGVLDVLFGDVEPSGRLSETIPLRLEDAPSYPSFPGELGVSRYAEGVFVGYRGYDQRRLEVAYPFGFGLGYTTFAINGVEVHAEGAGSASTLTVTADVTNTGSRGGATVVQVYVGDPDAAVARPERELKGFVRVELAPGATERVRLTLGSRALAYWHRVLGRWVVEGGEFVVGVGTSSRDIAAEVRVDVEGDDLRQPLTEMSTIGELMADPTIGAEIRAVVEQQPVQFQKQAPDIPAVTFVDFNIFDLDRDGLAALLARANAATQ